MRRLARTLSIALVALAALAVAAGIAWTLDDRAHEGRVARGVTLAGTPVGGLREGRLTGVVEELAGRYLAAEVRVEAPGGGFSTTAEALGLRVSVPDTVRSVMRVNRTGNVLDRAGGWVLGFLRPEKAPVRIAVDGLAVRRAVDSGDRGERRPPVEPGIAFRAGAFEPVPGKPGLGIDPLDVIEELPAAAAGGLPIVVRVDRGDVAPRIPVAEARRVAGEAQSRVSSGLPVILEGTPATVPHATVRTWVTSQPTETGLRLALDRARAHADIERLLADAGEPAADAGFEVVDGAVRVIPSRNGTACCDPAGMAGVEGAVLGSGTRPVSLALRSRPPQLSTEAAEGLGVKEPVGTFETRHPAGQPRVANIHRIADMVRGQLIAPGASFSVNGFVGPRTPEKGFVPAPIIEDGVFAEGVGGGVSQFATTLFNAAFFAGLDLEEYQAHSIYINRYPYGREATLNHPKPDLKIRNNTPHGVLIWPTYTDRTIKVTLYSTRFVVGQQTGQSRAPSGACTRVTTERTRTWVADGRQEVDKVVALYRPAEGVNC